jgi:nicotinamidase-related amidase
MKTLVIIDLQKGFNPSKKLVEDIIKESKKYSIVVATKFINGNGLFKKMPQFKKLNKADLNLYDLPEQTEVFEKDGYAISDELIKYLKSKKVTKVDICGLETDACVLASAYKFWDAGIEPNILYELTQTSSPALQKATKLISKRNFGV